MQLHGKAALITGAVGYTGKAIAVRRDMRDTASIDSMVKTVIKEFGRKDILVNAAGGSARPGTKKDDIPLGQNYIVEGGWSPGVKGR